MTTELENKIRALLMREWDPIGIRDEPAARDEYDSYVPPLARMVMAKKSPAELAGYLLNVETQRMGLTGNADRVRSVAIQLAELR